MYVVIFLSNHAVYSLISSLNRSNHFCITFGFEKHFPDMMGSDGKRIGVLNMNYVDFNYPDVVGITIIEGKPMTHAKDLLVNEEIVRLKKWTDGAVGKPFDEIKEGTIVGVFRDVRNQSFYQAQQPIVLIGGNAFNHTFNVRLKEPYDENLKR